MSNNKTDKFFMELGALFDPKGFDEMQNKIAQTEDMAERSFDKMGKNSDAFSAGLVKSVERGTKLSSSYLQGFFDKSSKSFLNLESVTKNIFNNIFDSFTSMITQMTAKAALSGLMSIFGGGAGLIGGLLGSRQTGGPIPQTGPYMLHAGEYVLPSDVVSSIKQNRAPGGFSASGLTGGGQINLTVNTPVTVNGSAGETDARRIAQQVSEAARRGAAWAIEHAKINYKIGRQRRGESSL